MFSSSCPGHVGPCPYVRRVSGTSELSSIWSRCQETDFHFPANAPGVLNAATLGRAAAIVRYRRHIADRGDDKTNSLQRAQRRLAARTRAGDFDFQSTHAMLDRYA